MQSTSAETFLDQLYEDLLENDMSDSNIETFKEFIKNNEYDTESIAYDIDDVFNSNVCHQINNPIYFECIQDFFMYLPKTKDDNDNKQEIKNEINNGLWYQLGLNVSIIKIIILSFYR